MGRSPPRSPSQIRAPLAAGIQPAWLAWSPAFARAASATAWKPAFSYSIGLLFGGLDTGANTKTWGCLHRRETS
eukprot:5300158-Pyramimonas_sp.AAC.1